MANKTKWNLHIEQNASIARLLAAVLEELEAKKYELPISNVAARFGTTYDSIYRVFERIRVKVGPLATKQIGERSSRNTPALEPEEVSQRFRKPHNNSGASRILVNMTEPSKTANSTRSHSEHSLSSIEQVSASFDDAMAAKEDCNEGVQQICIPTSQENHAKERAHYRNLYFPQPSGKINLTSAQLVNKENGPVDLPQESKNVTRTLQDEDGKVLSETLGHFDEIEPSEPSSEPPNQSSRNSLPVSQPSVMGPPERRHGSLLIRDGSFMDPIRGKCLLCNIKFRGQSSHKFHSHEDHSSLHFENLLNMAAVGKANKKVFKANSRRGMNKRTGDTSQGPAAIPMHENAAGPVHVYKKRTPQAQSSPQTNNAKILPKKIAAGVESVPDTDEPEVFVIEKHNDSRKGNGKGKSRAKMESLVDDLAKLRSLFPGLNDQKLGNIQMMGWALQQRSPSPTPRSKKRAQSEQGDKGSAAAGKRRCVGRDVSEDGDVCMDSGWEYQFSSSCDDSDGSDYTDADEEL